MPIPDYQIDRPSTWQGFEKLCHLLWMDLLRDPYTQMHGRGGQSQAGIDVYGNDKINGDILTGIQCKGKDENYGKKVTESELRKEVEKAKKFSPTLGIFILVTTAPNDVNIQKVARTITEEHKKLELFSVYVLGWGDICQRIAFSEKVIEVLYPHHNSFAHKLQYGIALIEDIVSKNNEKEDKSLKFFSNKDEITKCFSESSNALLSWPRTLQINNTWLERNEELDILAKFDSAFFSTTILLGDPGTGKSALLSKISQSIVNSGEIVLAIKADQLDNNIKDFDSLATSLGLLGSVDECLLAASKFGKVFLILDQLDTLSELVDVKTSRLSVLLNLIKKMDNEPNIHVLASSRPFEFKYDARLSSIKADRIELLPISWEVVEEKLLDNGIKIQSANENFKKFLCRPSNLNFYLGYIKNNPQKIFFSHIELYDDIWRTSLGDATKYGVRADFLMNAASAMTNEAKQVLPILRYEERSNDIDFLSEAGLLVKSKNGKSFSFAHQTLQAFAWTRAFVKQNESLCEFILEHQNNLNVRPKLSTALFYIREADPKEYDTQIAVMLGNRFFEFRKHIIHLLIEFVGSQQEPSAVEINLITALLKKQDLVIKICKAISGRALWFDSIKTYELSLLMDGTEIERYWVAIFLSSVLKERRLEVLEILKKNWQNPNGLINIYYTLRYLDSWDEPTLELANYLAVQDNLNEYIPSGLCDVIATNKYPEMAIRLAAQYFTNRLQKLIAKPLPEIEPLPDIASEMDQIIHHLKSNPTQNYEALLDFSTSWHNLPSMAKAAPVDFIEAFWPFFTTACGYLVSQSRVIKNTYTDFSGLWFYLSDDGRDLGDKYFCIALEKSVIECAKKYTNYFLVFYDLNKSSNSLAVQRILAKGLCALSNVNPSLGLDYLLNDERRFRLGNYFGDSFSGTKELIGALSTQLRESDLLILENAITHYKIKYVDSAQSSEYTENDLKHNRKIVYSLLSAIPANLLSKNAKDLMLQEEIFFGKSISKGVSSDYGGLVVAVSPMSEEQMEDTKDGDIIKCIKKYPDEGHNWPEDDKYFSPIEFARTLGNFSEKFPSRASKIILQLDTNNIYAVTHGLEGLSKSTLSLDFLLDTIEQLDLRLSNSDLYKEEAARAIENKLSNTEEELSEGWCRRLETWLEAPKESENQYDSEKIKEDNNKKVESILWGHGRMSVIPNGNYPILAAITSGYLNRKNPLIDSWILLLKKRIEQKGDLQIWLAFSLLHFPSKLRLCGSKKTEEIIDLLVKFYPEILIEREFAYMIAWAIHWVSTETFFNWLDQIINYGTIKSSQIAGELLGIKLAIHPSDEKANTLVTQTIIQKNDLSILYGLAYSLKNTWRQQKTIVTPYILKLIESTDSQLSYILLGVLRNTEKMDHCKELDQIIETFISAKTIETVSKKNLHITHSLLPIVEKKPLQVAELCKQLIILYGKNLGDVSQTASIETNDLITISITLHNLGTSYQQIGLDIFESLLDIDFYHTAETLKVIDDIPLATFVD